MNYLKEYNITDDEIKNIEKVFDAAEVNIDILKYNDEKVRTILNMFVNIGVKNIYNIIITNPYMFCDTISSIKSKINGYKDKHELARLLDEDPMNLEIIHLG